MSTAKKILQDLVQVPESVPCVLESIEGDAHLIERLSEIGFVPGETVQLLRKLVFQGPVVVQVRGVSVALRREEARCLKVSLKASQGEGKQATSR